ncbi:MAG TPA: PPOX class F420-dependent oxidoreductase [Roseiflexaceae bacterium]|nr:PPOX class F420-dependent oxidoreductase [Roseiflexaceae bacterium]
MMTSRTGEATTLLQGYHCLNLTTFRKDGTPVVTTVWFAQANDNVYVWTAKTSGKVKRIRNNPAVEIAPSTHLGQPRGPDITASARILSVLEQHVAEQAMNTKYGWQKQFFALIWRLQGQEQIYIEITPMEE